VPGARWSRATARTPDVAVRRAHQRGEAGSQAVTAPAPTPPERVAPDRVSGQAHRTAGRRAPRAHKRLQQAHPQPPARQQSLTAVTKCSVAIGHGTSTRGCPANVPAAAVGRDACRVAPEPARTQAVPPATISTCRQMGRSTPFPGPGCPQFHGPEGAPGVPEVRCGKPRTRNCGVQAERLFLVTCAERREGEVGAPIRRPARPLAKRRVYRTLVHNPPPRSHAATPPTAGCRAPAGYQARSPAGGRLGCDPDEPATLGSAVNAPPAGSGQRSRSFGP
jgi:hypothetical protein